MASSDSPELFECSMHRSFGHSQLPTFVCTPSGDILYRNEAAERLSPAPSARPLPSHVGAWLATEERERLLHALGSLHANNPALTLTVDAALATQPDWTLRAYLYGEQT